MYLLSDQWRDRLSGEALTLCLCWRLVRRDGFEVRLTDHDRRLIVDQVGYEPGASVNAGRFVQSIGLKPGRAAAAGALSHAAIAAEDLKAGLWNGCRVNVCQVDWQRPDLGALPIWSGYLSEIGVSGNGRFEAELVSLKADLERPIGRVIQSQCDALFGDERCGVEANGRSCDQRFETCRDTYQNTANFRGFPHLPGNDFILSGPATSGNDGGKR
ncbi:MAG: DUF2163 domain-containing protein [Pseudomonadota bacterium]